MKAKPTVPEKPHKANHWSQRSIPIRWWKEDMEKKKGKQMFPLMYAVIVARNSKNYCIYNGRFWEILKMSRNCDGIWFLGISAYKSAFLEDLLRISAECGFWPSWSDNSMKLEIPKMNEKSWCKPILTIHRGITK